MFLSDPRSVLLAGECSAQAVFANPASPLQRVMTDVHMGLLCAGPRLLCVPRFLGDLWGGTGSKAAWPSSQGLSGSSLKSPGPW